MIGINKRANRFSFSACAFSVIHRARYVRYCELFDEPIYVSRIGVPRNNADYLQSILLAN